MELNEKLIKWLIGLMLISLVTNSFLGIFAYWNREPSATKLINEAIDEIQMAVVRIDSAKSEIKNVVIEKKSQKLC